MIEVDDRVGCGADVGALQAAVAGVLAAEGAGACEVGIVLLDEHEMRAINREHRGRDEPTDVLAFPIDEDEGLAGVTRMLGDVVVCVPVLEAQADEAGVGAGAELLDLVVHGTLHLLGYDHETDQGEMLARQDALVGGFDPIPYPSA
ncbi:MAG: rRNA maturation RNase YbeY [Gaiellales bacterium]